LETLALHLAIAAVILLHLVFIATVVLGALLLWRWPRLVWVQLPVFLWGAVVNLQGWPCPLTTLENALRAHGGLAPYPESFVSHYLLPRGVAQAAGRHTELAIGLFVVVVNLVVYAAVLLRWRRRGV
jgi:Protein of Unknown function (DUF2784)